MHFRLLAFTGVVCALYPAAIRAQTYNISTLAGNGSGGFAGDGGSAAGSQLNFPSAIIVDSSGKIYIADSGNNRVRMISGGTISTVAGNGTLGYSGDKGPAASAALANPSGLALDSSGNLYIADTGNHVVRMVAGGTITTVAGNNSSGYSGDTGPATAANLASPGGVAVDSSGNLYIADTNNGVIRQVVKGTINTLIGAGSTAGKLTHPTAIVFDGAGALYIDDLNSRHVVKYTPSSGAILTVAGSGISGFSGDGGPATRASLNNAQGIAVDAAGNLYIADTTNNRVRKVTADGTIATIAGSGRLGYAGDGGTGLAASFTFPRGVAVDAAGKVYVADTNNHVIRLLQGVLPTISDNAVVNAASFKAQLSPGALASIFGTNLGFTATPDAPLPASVNGVSVIVNGQAAPLVYVSPTQINFQVPWAASGSTAAITVRINGADSNKVAVPLLTAAPGLFFVPPAAALVQNSDYTLNSPDNPVRPGGTIIAYLSGSGPVSPQVADGSPTPTTGFVQITSSTSAKIGTATATVAFGGLAPGFVGLVQMNITVPAGLAAGDYPLSVTINGETSNAANISVRP